MKKTFKSLSTLALALVLLLTLAVPALAVGENLTITVDTTLSGHTYEAYQIFAGDLSGSGSSEDPYVLSNITWGSGVDGEALLNALKADTTVGSRFTSATTAAAVAAAMEGIGDDSADTQAIAAVVGQYLTTVAGTSTQAAGPYTITGLDAGYYLVKDQDNSQTGGEDAYSRFMMEVVANATVAPKTGIPTVEKKVLENVKYPANDGYGAGYNDVADYSIGDAVPFKLIGTLPANYNDYAAYQYIFHDTLSAGLTYNGDARVYVDGAEISTGFTVNHTSGVLTITFSNLKSIASVTAASEVTVEYSAILNSSAAIGQPGNPNEVSLEYSNNPNPGGEGNTGETPKDKVIVFTYELDTNKVDGTDNAIKLAGAEFKLYKDVSGTDTYAIVTGGRLSGWTTVEADATTLTSGADGLFTVAGLDDGTYYLTETKAPTGYNRLEADVAVVLSATTANGQTWVSGDAADALTALAATADGASGTGNAATGIASINIANNKGTTLPSTGGIGTTIFYIVGGILMLGAAVLLITKKRVADKG